MSRLLNNFFVVQFLVLTISCSYNFLFLQFLFFFFIYSCFKILEYVKVRSDTLLTIRSIGLKARRADPLCLNLSKIILRNVKNKNKPIKSTTDLSNNAAPSVNPFAKKTPRRKSMMAAVRQSQASRKMRNISAILKKKKAIDLIENLDMLQDFLMSGNEGNDEGTENVSKYNGRVNVMEAYLAPPTVDVKTLRKKWDPIEDETLLEMREEGKGFSRSLMGWKTKRKTKEMSSTSSTATRKEIEVHHKIGTGNKLDLMKETSQAAAALE